MQKPGIFRTKVYSEPEANSEPCQTFTMECCAKIVKLQLFSQTMMFAISAFHVLYFLIFNKGLFLALKVFILCKKA